MNDMTNHPSFRSANNTPAELVALAKEYGVEVEVDGFNLDFGDGYTVECATFEDACQEIRLYAANA